MLQLRGMISHAPYKYNGFMYTVSLSTGTRADFGPEDGKSIYPLLESPGVIIRVTESLVPVAE